MGLDITYTPSVKRVLGKEGSFSSARLLKKILQSFGLVLTLSSFNPNGSELYNTSRTDPIELPYAPWHSLIESKVGDAIYRSPDGSYQEYATRNPSLFLLSFQDDTIQLIKKIPGGHEVLLSAKKP